MEGVLVLNKGYEPLHRVSIQHAIRMLVRGVAEVEKAVEGQNFGHCRRVHQPAAPHESLSVTARLNTGLPSPESR